MRLAGRIATADTKRNPEPGRLELIIIKKAVIAAGGASCDEQISPQGRV